MLHLRRLKQKILIWLFSLLPLLTGTVEGRSHFEDDSYTIEADYVDNHLDNNHVESDRHQELREIYLTESKSHIGSRRVKTNHFTTHLDLLNVSNPYFEGSNINQIIAFHSRKVTINWNVVLVILLI